jgi:hypothetical protein
MALPRVTAALISLTLVFAVPAAPALSAPVVRTPGDPLYTVKLRGGMLGHTWKGTEQIKFTNTGTTSMGRVWLRLWSNGVQGCMPRAIRITDIQLGALGRFSRACTAVPVHLDSPIGPGESTALRLSIVIRLPEMNDRFGWWGGLALMGTALPTLAIHDDAGWHLDPFVDLGESFYSVVGRYRVTLDVPTGLDTPATGTRVRREIAAGRTIDTFRATDVRDFAWAAGRFTRVGGTSGPTDVHVWYLPGVVSAQKAATMVDTSEASLDTFSSAFGTYPYPEADVVLTGFTAFGGMEYPQVVFSNTERTTIAHELAHQWWYGIVGNNEFAEPWLDESFATWSQYLPFGAWKSCPSYSFSAGARLTNDMAYWRDHTSAYGTIYGGGGCMLANLSHRFGLHRFERILGRYAKAHWLGIARTPDFRAAIEAAAAAHLPGFDTDAFWAEWRVD